MGKCEYFFTLPHLIITVFSAIIYVWQFPLKSPGKGRWHSMLYRTDPHSLEAGIISELEKLRIFDCHEHLPSESQWLSEKHDAFTLFSHYCQHDLYTAGLGKDVQEKLLWSPGDLDWKWSVFEPFYEKMKDTCYCRAAHVTLEKFCGVPELTRDNYRAVSEAVAAQDTPGIYSRVLADACGIEKAINCDGKWDETEGGLLAQTVWIAHATTHGDLTEYFGTVPQSAAEAAKLATARLDRAARAGAVGMKLFAFDTAPAAESEAEDCFRILASSPGAELPRGNAFNRYLKLAQMKHCARLGLTCCVHTGYWNDYRELDPSGLLPFIRENHFHPIDLYHVGYPYVREAIMLGKVWPGVRINMAWTYLISRRFAFDALDEMLEMLPDNKIFGFGGDYYVPHKIFGHLCMARECIASVLAEKIRRREMSLERALHHGKRMLRDNPREFYGF